MRIILSSYGGREASLRIMPPYIYTPREACTTGRLPTYTPREACTTGRLPTYTPREAYIPGYTLTYTPREAYIPGYTSLIHPGRRIYQGYTSHTPREAYIPGLTPFTPREAYRRAPRGALRPVSLLADTPYSHRLKPSKTRQNLSHS